MKMREIKFRAWDTSFKKMQYFNQENPITFPVMNLACQLMQYTGLKDKNGKKIYEGDIVKYDKHTILQIEWLDGEACFHYKYLKSRPNVVEDIRMYRSDEEWKVIGNIYENPELLTGKGGQVKMTKLIKKVEGWKCTNCGTIYEDRTEAFKCCPDPSKGEQMKICWLYNHTVVPICRFGLMITVPILMKLEGSSNEEIKEVFHKRGE